MVLSMPIDLPLFPELAGSSLFKPASAERVQAVLAAAIATGQAGYMTRSGELLLAGLCARFIAERLDAAGLVVVELDGP